MIDPEVEKLLILQDKDLRKIELEAKLTAFPLEEKSLRQKIEQFQETMVEQSKKLQEQEVERKRLEGDIQEAEERINKCKNQQLQVKKNEEYQALEHEMATFRARIEVFEEKELTLLFAIDELKKRVEVEKVQYQSKIKDCEEAIVTLVERMKECNERLKRVETEIAEALQAVSPVFLKAYERAKARVKKGPFVVLLEARKCSGCHLKVSSENLTVARQGGEPVNCDSCGRIVYVDQ